MGLNVKNKAIQVLEENLGLGKAFLHMTPNPDVIKKMENDNCIKMKVKIFRVAKNT